MKTKKPTYAEGWKEFSKRIRFERAKGQCECIGECGLHPDHRCIEMDGQPAIFAQGKVMLTVAHLDAKGGVCDCHVKSGIKCVIDEHCKAMCNRCHLVYDVPQHKFNARRNRAEKIGQQWLGDMA